MSVLDMPVSKLPDLSSGQAQLFALARALITKRTLVAGSKPVLLLDEPTAAIDPVTEAKILDVINAEFGAEGYSIILITHRPEAVIKRSNGRQDLILLM
jgi:ABC-type multidrug transport system fused ATPase/permease subunit